MKKLLSVVLALMLVIAALPTFAAENAIGATGFADDTEYEYNLKTLANGLWLVGGANTTSVTFTAAVNKGAMAVFKLPLPALEDTQEFSNYTFKFCDSKEASNRGVYYRVVGLDGIDESKLVNGSLSTADNPVASAINWDNYSNAGILDAALVATEEAFNDTSYFTYKADITGYANERLEAGDDALYVGVYAQYSYSIFGYSDSSVAQCRVPYVYFTAQKKQVFEHTIEGYRWVGNKTKITEGYMVTGGVPTVASGNKTSTYISGKGNFAVYKVALPEVAEGEGYKHFILSFGCGVTGSVFKMPGEDWDLTQTLADTDWYKKIIVESTAEEFKANDAAVLVEDNPYFDINLADITTYANQCLNAGQTYMYLAVGGWSSTSNTTLPSMTDSSYVAAGCNPSYYYRVGEAVETDPLPGQPEEEPEVPFDHTIEGYQAVGNLTAVQEGYKSVAGVVSEASGSFTSSYMKKDTTHAGGNFVIYKIAMPEVPEGKEINHFILRFGGSKVPMRVLKMPGTDWAIPGTISDTAWYAAILAASTVTQHHANDAAVIVEEPGGSYNNFYADITSYVQDCYNAGQEYFYVAAGGFDSTANVANHCMTDSTYVAAGNKPQYYYSFADAKPIEFKSTSVEDGGYVGDVEAGVDFVFTAEVANATATINDEPAEVEINNAVVTVKNLNKNIANIIEVIATDASGNEATASITVNGYGKKTLTMNTYVVNSAGSKAGTYNPSASYVATVIFRIPLPEVAEGKEIENFTFNFITPNTLGNIFQLVKLPGEDWDVANLIQTDGEVPEGLTNIYSFTQDPVSYNYVNKATRAKITSERVDIAPSATNDDGKSYMNYANLSQYARECIANGQSTMWLAVRSNSTVAITGVGDTTHAGAGRLHTVTWTLKDADAAIAAPKAVLAADEASYDEAAGETVLAKETEYKFITKANVAGKLVVAQYDANGKFVSVDAVELDGLGADVTATFTTGAEDGFVKVFVWAADEMAPADDDITVLAIK